MAAKDYTNYLIYINSYMIALIVIYVIFFNTDYKRAKVCLTLLRLGLLINN